MSASQLELHEEIGRGGQGVVVRAYLIHPSGPRREVAVKQLMPAHDLAYASNAVARLKDEAMALAALNHPSIPDFVDLVVVDDTLSLLTRFVEGYDLSDLLDEGKVLPPRACASLLLQVVDALDCAWRTVGAQGVPLHLVHRDLKPSNLRVDRRGHAWILDFGLAHGKGQVRHAETQTALLVGTPAYLAPERLAGAAPSPAGDVFALGLIGLELLGAPMALPGTWLQGGWDTLTSPTAWGQRVEARRQEVQGVPEALMDLLVQMAAWEDTARPTAAEVRERLAALRDGLPGEDLGAWAAGLPARDPGPSGPGRAVVVRALDAGEIATVPPAPVAPRRWQLVSALLAVCVLLLAVWSWVGRPPSPSAGGAPGGTGAPVAPATPPRSPVGMAAATPATPPPTAGAPTAGVPDVVEDAPPQRPVRRPGAPPPAPSVRPAPPQAVAGGDEVAAAPSPTAQWRAKAPSRVRLRQGEVRIGPGALEPGVWMAEADFGEGFVPAGEVLVPAGGDVVVACMPWLGLCEVEP